MPKYCPTCGFNLAKKDLEPKYCHNCGLKMTSKVDFCPKCGKKVIETITPMKSMLKMAWFAISTISPIILLILALIAYFG